MNISFWRVLLILPVILHCLASDAKSSPQTDLNVLALLPLTGDAAAWGTAVKNGMELGREALPAEIRARLHVTYDDDALSAKTAVTALTRNLERGRPDVVINLSSGTGNALAPITESKKITLLSISSDSAISRGSKYAFSFWVTPEIEAQELVPEMKRRGYKKIAIVSVIHTGAFAAISALKAENNNAVDVTLQEDFPPDARDFKPFLVKLKAKEKDIDAIMIMLFPGQISIFVRQLKEMGITKELFGWETLEDQTEIKLSKGGLNGAWFVTADDGDGSFLKKFNSRFPGTTSLSAANGYDAVQILGKAIQQQVVPGKVNEYFATLKDFSGALGTYSASGDQRFHLPAAIKEIRGDVIAKRTAP